MKFSCPLWNTFLTSAKGDSGHGERVSNIVVDRIFNSPRSNVRNCSLLKNEKADHLVLKLPSKTFSGAEKGEILDAVIEAVKIFWGSSQVFEDSS